MTRALIPEVIQSSAMDCGPAALKALLHGHGIAASYSRLREACQTELDGTSIDTLEEAAVALGLDAVQVLVPEDHLAHRAASLLPAMVVTTIPGGGTHFVVVWRRMGERLQVMDPASGRHFLQSEEFRRKLYLHTMRVDAAAWRTWAGADGTLRVLRARMADAGIDAGESARLIRTACDDASWRGLGALDAAVRMMASLRNRAAIRNAGDVARALVSAPESIPLSYWRVRACDAESAVLVTGAVLLSVSGTCAPAAALPPQLEAVLASADEPPLRTVLRLVRRDSAGTALMLLAAMFVAAAGVAAEAVLFRGFLDVSRRLVTNRERVAFAGSVLALLAFLLLLEWPILIGVLRIGRRLELRLRIDLMSTLARLPDRYFRSRLASDMAHRAHAVHEVREISDLIGRLIRAAMTLLFILVGLAVLYDGLMPMALGAAIVAAALPLFAQPMLAEKDLKVRTGSGSLARFYLDALIGLVPIRIHGARAALAHEQSVQIGGWARAVLGLRRGVVAWEGVQYSLGLALAILLVTSHLRHADDPGGALLLAWWGLGIPLLGQDIATCAWQLPRIRNTVARVMEPLREEDSSRSAPHESGVSGGAAIDLENVTVLAGGHVILDDVSLHIARGEHVAIVGSSGAGKSTLAGLLLGWHEPARGALRFDCDRRDVVWVDPQVHLWNDSAMANICYGNDSVPDVVRDARLIPMLRRLRGGLAAKLGENGALLSAADGQRMRIARALGREDARLVLCDEAGRGLDRDERRHLLRLVTTRWPGATVLYVTHDLEDALELPRVLVVENARIVEDGDPRALAARPDSRFRALLDAEARLAAELKTWTRYRLEDGEVRR
ncbi:MAG TPA: cysteine peptidase family C39 domain-containing protein [Thermoanaerobaculia bacterium]